MDFFLLRGLASVTGALGVLLSMLVVAQAAESTVEAFSSWEAKGQMYPTGPQEMSFVGVLSGVLYVRGDDGSFDAGLIACPGTVVINTADGSQVGTGKCVIITPDAERVYAQFECMGLYGQGCNGDFELTGGTGSKTNISGGGEVQFKSAFTSLIAMPGNIVEKEAIGMAIWPALTYRLPNE